MVVAIRLHFLAALLACILVIAAVTVAYAQLGFHVPMPAQCPCVSIGNASSGKPALVTVVAQVAVIGSQELEVQVESAHVELTTMGMNADEVGSPDKPGGEIPQTKRKVIHLHHEHTRTFSIGAVDSAIRDTFKL